MRLKFPVAPFVLQKIHFIHERKGVYGIGITVAFLMQFLLGISVMIIWKFKSGSAANYIGYDLPSCWVEVSQAMMFPVAPFGCSYGFGQQWSLRSSTSAWCLRCQDFNKMLLSWAAERGATISESIKGLCYAFLLKLIMIIMFMVWLHISKSPAIPSECLTQW